MNNSSRKIVIIGLLVFVSTAFAFLFYKSHINFDLQNIYGKENIVPILIIGSGCAGDSAAIYGARGNAGTIVIVGNQPGGQLSGTTKVENFPGVQGELGPDIMMGLQKQAESFGAQFIQDKVKNVDLSHWPYEVITEQGKIFNALTIIIATGASPVRLGIGEEFWGKGMTTCATCDAPFHKGSDVIVVGGGDSAVEEAMQLSSYAKTVFIAVRKEAMRAAPAMQNKLKDYDNIKVLYNTEIKQIDGDDKGISSVQLYNNLTNVIDEVPVTGVFLAIGHSPNSELFKPYVKTDANGYIITEGKTQATSVPGVFAAGDVEDSHYRQAGVAAGSGIRAALDALGLLQEIGFNAAAAKKVQNNIFKPESKAQESVVSVSTLEDFESFRSQQAVLVVDIYTQFCPSCKYMLPAYASVAQKFDGKAQFIKIDANQIESLARTYKINAVPTLLLFKDGKLIERQSGALSETELEKFVNKAFKEPR